MRASCFLAQSGQMTSLVLINSSNARRLTSFLLPTKSTKGQFGGFNEASILLTPMLLYSAASLMVKRHLQMDGHDLFYFGCFPGKRFTVFFHILFAFCLSIYLFLSFREFLEKNYTHQSHALQPQI